MYLFLFPLNTCSSSCDSILSGFTKIYAFLNYTKSILLFIAIKGLYSPFTLLTIIKKTMASHDSRFIPSKVIHIIFRLNSISDFVYSLNTIPAESYFKIILHTLLRYTRCISFPDICRCFFLCKPSSENTALKQRHYSEEYICKNDKNK